MEWLSEFLFKIRSLTRRSQMERDLEEEMRLHVAMKSGDLENADAARRAFGNVTLLREESRQAWGWTWIERLIQDLRYALRVLRKSPGFTVIAVATVALGVAANVTVFSFINALFLRTLSVPNGDRLVRIYGSSDGHVSRDYNFREYQYLRAHATKLDEVVAHYSTAPLYAAINGESGEIQGAVVSSNYFPMLGVKPALGRFFTSEEDSVADRDAVAVIGYGLWRSRFAGDPAVLGHTVTLNTRTFQIVGVAPEGFGGVMQGLAPNQVWIPLMMARTGYRFCDAIADPACHNLDLAARLAPGATPEKARVEMAELFRQVRGNETGEDGHLPMTVQPLMGVRPGQRQSFSMLSQLLATAAALLLLIACANLGGLLLARGASRSKEIAMRVSLGASRLRVIRQLLTESVLLAGCGGALGVVLSLWTSRLLFSFYTKDSEGYQRFYELSIDPRLLAFAAGVSILTGILFGILPALQASRADTTDALKAQGAGSIGGRARLRTVLTAAQVALSLALLVAAGLAASSASNLENSAGFDAHRVAGLRLRPRLVSYTPEKAQAFLREVVNRLSVLPGVECLTLTRGQGSVWNNGFNIPVRLPNQPPPSDPKRAPLTGYQEVGSRYFETLRIARLAGREFDDRDRPGSPRVAVVNESLARRLWSRIDVLDQAVILDDHAYRVVGVVGDSILQSSSETPVAMAYIPFWQNNTTPQVDARFAIRVKGDPSAALAGIKQAIAGIDPDVPITESIPLIDQVRGHFTDVRVASAVLSSAGGLALLLAALGLYGVISFSAGRRTREVGIRMALGARQREVVAMFVRQGARLLIAGAMAGLVLAIATTRLLATWLYGVSASDPRAFAIALVVLAAVALAASWIPARRAARTDPMTALRVE